MPSLTWEQAVEWLRRQPEQTDLVEACYFDDPIIDAALRFEASSEWAATMDFLPEKGKALDLGAGRGMTSFALARAGWDVCALEPDPSAVVGSRAIRSLAEVSGVEIEICEETGEELPFPDRRFDVVYGRQVLHHAKDLDRLCREAARVLKPSGRFIAVREHVISGPEDLQVFLDNHPLHRLYGGENAYQLSEYEQAIRGSGLCLLDVLGPYDSAINYFPLTRDQWFNEVSKPLARLLGTRLTRRLLERNGRLRATFIRRLALRRSRRDNAPGRLYSFVAEKRVG